MQVNTVTLALYLKCDNMQYPKNIYKRLISILQKSQQYHLYYQPVLPVWMQDVLSKKLARYQRK